MCQATNCSPDWVLSRQTDIMKTNWDDNIQAVTIAMVQKRGEWDIPFIFNFFYQFQFSTLVICSWLWEKKIQTMLPCQVVTALHRSSVSFQVELGNTRTGTPFIPKTEIQTNNPSRHQENCFKENNCHLSFWHQKWSRSMLCLPCTNSLQRLVAGKTITRSWTPIIHLTLRVPNLFAN